MLLAMRLLVLALVVAVSPLGPAVCETMCAVHETHDERAAAVSNCHAGEFALAHADSDHDCQHQDQDPAVLKATTSLTDTGGVSPGPVAALVTRFELVASARLAVLTAASPPPLSPPVPLRI